jgi:hypothetical protein
LDIIVLDTPSGEVIEISSSSCDLSIFFSKAGSQRGKLDETSREGTSTGTCQGSALPEPSSIPLVRGTNEGGAHVVRRLR